MPIVKHKIFEVSINNTKKFDEKVLSLINEFLSDSNFVYINHSVCTFSEDFESYGDYKTICTSIIISIIYKDLNETSFTLDKSSKKTKDIVHKEIYNDTVIEEPIIDTDFDKHTNYLGEIKDDIYYDDLNVSNDIDT